MHLNVVCCCLAVHVYKIEIIGHLYLLAGENKWIIKNCSYSMLRFAATANQMRSDIESNSMHEWTRISRIHTVCNVQLKYIHKYNVYPNITCGVWTYGQINFHPNLCHLLHLSHRHHHLIPPWWAFLINDKTEKVLIDKIIMIKCNTLFGIICHDLRFPCFRLLWVGDVAGP